MKIEISNRKKTGHFTNMWKLNNKFLQPVIEEIIRETRKYLEMSENNNKTYQNLQNAAKAVLREKFTAVNTYIKKGKISNQ